MKPYIIAISGKIGSGKTTFSNHLAKLLREQNKIVEEKAWADKLRKVCYELTGYYGYTQEEKNLFLPTWDRTVGQVLQQLGTDVLRDHFDKNVWVKSTLSNLSDDTIYIIGDTRFPNEADAVKNLGGIVIRLEGDPVNINACTLRDKNHSSETGLDNYLTFDELFVNNKELIDLYAFAEKIIKTYIK
ncbi:MAG: P-loop NTPase fold protein [Bacteroidia bacterium]